MSKRYSHILSPVQVGNLMFKTRLTSTAGAHYSPTLPDRALNGASCIYVSHIDIDTSLLALAAAPNGANAPGGPRMSDKQRASYDAIIACIDKIHDLGSYAVTMPMGDMPHRGGGPGDPGGPGGPGGPGEPGGGPGAGGGPQEGGGDMQYDPNDPEKQLYAEREGVLGHDIGWITEEGIWQYIHSTVENAKNLKLAGFDLLSIHCAYHNNIADEFWSTQCNHRTDAWGGTTEKRARVIVELFKALRKALGPDYPLEIILTAEGKGHSFDDTLKLIALLGDTVDIIHVRTDYKDTQHPIGYTVTQAMPSPNLEVTARLKNALVERNCHKLVQVSAGFCDPELMEQVLAQGQADLIAIHRFWHADDDFLTKLREDRGEDVVPCIKCNRCGQCPVNPSEVFDARTKALIVKPVGKKKQVAVVGGGPGGMYAAMLLADRGHQVTLFEKELKLGGQVRHADVVSFKWPLAVWLDWLTRQLRKRENVTLCLGLEATPERLKAGHYDDVIVAIGPKVRELSIPGLTAENTCHAVQAYEKEDLPRQVVILGGSETGMEVGIHLAELGHDITVMTRQGMLAPEAPHSHYIIMIMDKFKAMANFHYKTFVRSYDSYDGKALTWTNKDGRQETVEAGFVVVCAGTTSSHDAAMAFGDCAENVHYIGDCVTPSNIHAATLAAWREANQI